jgi:hypothetical protein
MLLPLGWLFWTVSTDGNGYLRSHRIGMHIYRDFVHDTQWRQSIVNPSILGVGILQQPGMSSPWPSGHPLVVLAISCWPP